MIRRTRNGYQVTSEAGKPLSKDDLTKEQAEERLKQVEAFKHAQKWAKKKRGG